MATPVATSSSSNNPNGPSSSPYRNEVDALKQRQASLEQEASRLKAETQHLEGLRTREQEIARELAEIAQKIGARPARRALPMLDNVKVASPCNASWDEMLGDDRVRFCVSCEKNVYNLSAMPRAEAEELLADRLGGELCVRFYQRADGTILTQDCPVGVKKKQRKKLALAVAGAGAMALAASSMLSAARSKCGIGVTQGEMVYEPRETNVRPQPTEIPTMGEPSIPNDERGEWKTGDRAVEPPPTPHVMGSVAPQPPEPTPPVHLKMGRRAK